MMQLQKCSKKDLFQFECIKCDTKLGFVQFYTNSVLVELRLIQVLQVNTETLFIISRQINMNAISACKFHKIGLGFKQVKVLVKLYKTLKLCFGIMAQPNSDLSHKNQSIKHLPTILIYRSLTTPSRSYAHDQCRNTK